MKKIDETAQPKTLKQVNQFLATFSEWKAVRDPHGYYYFVHPRFAPTSGVYTFSLRGTTFAFWRAEHDERTAEVNKIESMELR